MRLVFITLEFSASTFSGNGIYARSQVRALANSGRHIIVISGKPAGYVSAPEREGAVELLEVELPSWGSLDRSSAWEAFAAGAGSQAVVSAVADFGAAAVLGVDWTSHWAYENLSSGLSAAGTPVPPFVFMNYRVYHRSASAEDLDFIAAMESSAMKQSILTTVLSRSDAEYIQSHLRHSSGKTDSAPIEVLLPALRSDMERLPLPPDITRSLHACGDSLTGSLLGNGHAEPAFSNSSAACSAVRAGEEPCRQRRYLTCCVRLSPEKEPERFVAILEQLAKTGALQRLGVVPLLCGSAKGEYAGALKARLRAAVPGAAVEERFLGPADLARIFAATTLNLHPPLYDAYGMTVVEAASQGAPSLVNTGGHVGAADLLSAQGGEIFEADYSLPTPELAKHVETLLEDKQSLLAAVGAAAAAKARSWTEASNAQKLVRLVENTLKPNSSFKIEQNC